MAAISSAKDELVSPAEYKLQASTASGYGARRLPVCMKRTEAASSEQRAGL